MRNEMQNFKTPVFELLSSLAARVYAQNPALYFSIQKQPRAESTQSVFSRALSRVQTLLDNATLDEFTEHHERVKKWIGDTNVVALDHVISSAIRTIADERKLIRSHLGDVVCMRNIETGKIHYGLLESIDPPLVRIRKRKETVALSLKKVTLLSTEEKHAWLVATGKTGHMFVSFLAPRAAKSHTIANIVGTVHGVVSAQVWDEYIRDAETSEVKQTIKVCVDPDVGADSIAVAIRDLLTDLGYKVV